MSRLKTFIRSLPALPLMALAALCAASPALSHEERVKHPQPVDSLLYPNEYEKPQSAREPAATTTQPVSPRREGAAATVAPSKSATKAPSKSAAPRNTVQKKRPATSPVDTAKPKGASGSPTQTVTTPDAEKKTSAPERKK